MKAIITFHSIDTRGSVLSYPPTALATLLEALARSEMPVLSLDELLKDETKKGITLTFDDGMQSLYTEGLPILRDFSVPAHLYLTTNSIGKNNRWPTQPKDAPGFDMLTWEQVEKLHEAGVYIDAHTHNHPDMRALSVDEMKVECVIADDLIEKRVGRRPEYFAYPYGYKNDAVMNYVRNHYKATVTTELRTLGANEDFSILPRLDSYYLQSNWLQKNLDSFFGQTYLSLRSRLRTLRGTQ